MCTDHKPPPPPPPPPTTGAQGSHRRPRPPPAPRQPPHTTTGAQGSHHTPPPAPKAATGAQGRHHHPPAPKAATRRPRQPPAPKGSHRFIASRVCALHIIASRSRLLRGPPFPSAAPSGLCPCTSGRGEGYAQAALKPQGEPRRDEGPELGERALVDLDEPVRLGEVVAPGPRLRVQYVELPH